MIRILTVRYNIDPNRHFSWWKMKGLSSWWQFPTIWPLVWHCWVSSFRVRALPAPETWFYSIYLDIKTSYPSLFRSADLQSYTPGKSWNTPAQWCSPQKGTELWPCWFTPRWALATRSPGARSLSDSWGCCGLVGNWWSSGCGGFGCRLWSLSRLLSNSLTTLCSSSPRKRSCAGKG